MKTDKFPGILDAKIVQPRDVRVAITECPEPAKPGMLPRCDVSINGVVIRKGVTVYVARRLFNAIVQGLEAQE